MPENQQNRAALPIGIFDSGIGGLTVVRAIKKCMPKEKIIYFGDTANLPYGDKSKRTLIKYSLRIVNFFLSQGVKAIVVACNSATANAWEEIEANITERVLAFNVIDPVVNKIAFETYSNIGIIATQSTTRSEFYIKKFHTINKSLKIFSLATPLLVPIIEEGLTESKIAELALSHYLKQKQIQHIDTLILGCTHYPVIYNQINAFYRGKVNIIDSPMIVARYIKSNLLNNDLLNTAAPNVKEDFFYVSDYTPGFEKMAKQFFGKKIKWEQLSL